ncbi:hypothetical protein ALC60_04444, partial [Trachymyrmex zeteki]
NEKNRISAAAMIKIHELWFELIDHSPYLPDLAPKETMWKNKIEFNQKITCFYVRLKTFQTTLVFQLMYQKCYELHKAEFKPV